MNEQFRMIAQNYCGMTPKDKGCNTWGEMQQKMADELEAVVKNNIVLPDVSGRSELLVSFLKWYVKDEMMRKEKELITSIVERYLNETNSH